MFGVITQGLHVTHGTINDFVRVVVQGGMLQQLHAKQHECHQGDQVDPAGSVQFVQKGEAHRDGLED